MFKSLNKKTKRIIIISIVSIIILIIIWPSGNSDKNTAKVERMPFTLEIEAMGELQALKFENITVPDIMNDRSLRIYYLNIIDIVDEGTKVKKGDYVANLDPADVVDRLKRSAESIDEQQHDLQKAFMDSTLALSQKRDEILNAIDNVTENEIKVEQSKFESKAIQRQTQIALDNARLDLKRKKRNLQKELLRQEVKIKRTQKYLNEELERKKGLDSLKKELKIKAPSDGMVIYAKSWGNRKIKVNSTVGPWAPVIAIIPDLNSLASEAIVKEIDIAKIAVGQKVRLTIEAFPDKEFNGIVSSIANIGQQMPKMGMNGFKVIINLENNNEPLLPGMTTSNHIITNYFPDALVVPRAAVFNNDSVKYVYKNEEGNPVKTIVTTGGENETQFRIISGLKEGDIVFLERPDEFKEDTNQIK